MESTRMGRKESPPHRQHQNRITVRLGDSFAPATTAALHRDSVALSTSHPCNFRRPDTGNMGNSAIYGNNLPIMGIVPGL